MLRSICFTAIVMALGFAARPTLANNNGFGGFGTGGGFGQSGFGQMGQSSFGQSGFGQSGFGQMGQMSLGQTGFGQSGFGQSGFGQTGQSGFGQMGTTASPFGTQGFGNSNGGIGSNPFGSLVGAAAAGSAMNRGMMGGMGMGGMGMGGMGMGGMGMGGMGMGRNGMGGRGMNGMNQLGGMNGMNQNQNKPALRATVKLGFSPTTVSNTARTNEINGRIKLMPNPTMRGVSVQVQGRTAVISGRVPTLDDGKMVERLLSLEPGIDGVRNELEYESGETNPASPESLNAASDSGTGALQAPEIVPAPSR